VLAKGDQGAAAWVASKQVNVVLLSWPGTGAACMTGGAACSTRAIARSGAACSTRAVARSGAAHDVYATGTASSYGINHQ
jgi:hypothetical protein